ncbi:hypothetical protein [Bacillus sp. FJAT-27445]|uniref:DUF7674 family protein n=1 Tax=Bacillus sp. FJAT-27445 TaxID=1679166 RepID=UPI000743AF6B|nr:hypothetical protein [Bacillus sp. FJAT-27445]
MEYNNLINRLLNDIPQIRPMYEEEIEWLEEDLPHVIFGIIVTPFIIKQLQENQKVTTLFDFLEEMALCNDEKVQEVLVVSVLELLITEREIIDLAKNMMGNRTKQLCTVTEKAYGY